MSANSCMTCRFAEWKQTVTGRLHPSGDGKCKWVFVSPVIPKAFSFGYSGASVCKLYGSGYINRKNFLPDDCPTWEAK